MKNGKKPTRREKAIIQKYGLNVRNWLVSKRNGDKITIVHRETNRIKELPTC
jgi:hypothetical protein